MTESMLYDEQEQHIFGFLNANNANISVHDKAYRGRLDGVEILPGGFGVDIANMILEGRKFNANLNRTDFIPSVLVYLDKPLTIAMVGSTQTVLENAVRKFSLATPWHKFIPISDGYSLSVMF